MATPAQLMVDELRREPTYLSLTVGDILTHVLGPYLQAIFTVETGVVLDGDMCISDSGEVITAQGNQIITSRGRTVNHVLPWYVHTSYNHFFTLKDQLIYRRDRGSLRIVNLATGAMDQLTLSDGVLTATPGADGKIRVTITSTNPNALLGQYQWELQPATGISLTLPAAQEPFPIVPLPTTLASLETYSPSRKYSTAGCSTKYRGLWLDEEDQCFLRLDGPAPLGYRDIYHPTLRRDIYFKYDNQGRLFFFSIGQTQIHYVL